MVLGARDRRRVLKVARAAEQGMEGGVQVGVEEGEPTLYFGATARAAIAGQLRRGCEIGDVVEDRRVLGQHPRVHLQRGYRAGRIDRQIGRCLHRGGIEQFKFERQLRPAQRDVVGQRTGARLGIQFHCRTPHGQGAGKRTRPGVRLAIVPRQPLRTRCAAAASARGRTCGRRSSPPGRRCASSDWRSRARRSGWRRARSPCVGPAAAPSCVRRRRRR